MSNNINITPVAPGQTAKETAINTALAQYDAALTEVTSLSVAAGNITVSDAVWRANATLIITGATVAGRTVTVPTIKRRMVIVNDAGNTFAFSLVRGTTTVSIPVGENAELATDGTANGLYKTAGSGGAGGGASAFTDLSDVPASYSGQGGKLVKVNAGATGLEFVAGGGGVAAFTDLSDVPTSYAGEGGKFVKVNAGATGLEFVTGSGGGATAFTDLSDVPASYSGQALKVVRVNAGATALEFATASGGSPSLADITDGPGAPAGNAFMMFRVNSGGTAAQYEEIPYDIGFSVEGVTLNSEVVGRFVAPRSFQVKATAPSSQAVAGTAATGSTTYTIAKNGTSFGTVVFSAAGTTGSYTVASDTSFAAGDVLTVTGPATADSTLANIGFTVAAVRI